MRIAAKLFELPKEYISQIKFISPNIYELNAIATHLGCDESLLKNDEVNDVELLFKENTDFREETKKYSGEISKLIDNVIVTLGSNGLLITNRNTPDKNIFDLNLRYNKQQLPMQHRLYNIDEKYTNIVNVSGAGDSFNVGFITAMINR